MTLRFTLILALMIGLNTDYKAQVVNGSFENWVFSNSGMAEYPVDWTSNNGLTIIKLVTRSVGKVNYGVQLIAQNDIAEFRNAILCNGKAKKNQPYQLNLDSAGQPFTGRPNFLGGSYMGQNDNSAKQVAEGWILLSKYNSQTKVSDTVGYGKIVFEPSWEFRNFQIPIQYYNQDNPDTALIVFSHSMDPSIQPDTTGFIRIDELFFDSNVGVEAISPELTPLYPNPISSELSLKNVQIGSAIRVYNITGELVHEEVYNGNNIDIRNLANGGYFLQIENNDLRTMLKFLKK